MGDRVQGDERRKARRVDATLALNLHIDLPGADAAAGLETINVSSTGVYFRSRQYIEPMTKLSLNFEVPTDDGGAKAHGALRGHRCPRGAGGSGSRRGSLRGSRCSSP